jgi:hypothetical protein
MRFVLRLALAGVGVVMEDQMAELMRRIETRSSRHTLLRSENDDRATLVENREGVDLPREARGSNHDDAMALEYSDNIGKRSIVKMPRKASALRYRLDLLG